MPGASGIGGVNPITRLVEAVSPTWDAAGERISSWTSDPFTELQEMGDYAEAAAYEQWQQLRETYRKASIGANAVVGMLQTPCEDKWSVAIRLARPAAGQAFLLMLSMSPEEVIENYLQPKRDRNKKRRKAKGGAIRRAASASGRIRRAFPDVPDIDDQTSRLLPGRELVQGRKVGLGELIIFEGIDRLDRVLWHFLIFEVGAEFWWQWSSNMMEARFCSQPADNYFNFSQSNSRDSASALQLFTVPPGPDDLSTKGWDAFDSGAINLINASTTSGRLVWSASAIITNTDDVERTVDFRVNLVWRRGGNIVQSWQSEPQERTIPPNSTVGITTGLSVETPDTGDEWTFSEQCTGIVNDMHYQSDHQVGFWPL